MTKKKLEIKSPKDSATFLWKYLDLHKFISFLTKRQMFFTRLDKFDDPIEGIRTDILRSLTKSGKPIDADSQKRQQRNYVNCWFAGERESMAMWNLYSNFDSVVIKVKFNLLKCKIEESFKQFKKSNTNLTLVGESVEYLKLNPFDSKLPLQNFRYSALKKEMAFEYENEYKFLINDQSKEEPANFYEVPINFEGLKLEVITHPIMESWKFTNLENLINIICGNSGNTKIDISIKKSATILRQKV